MTPLGCGRLSWKMINPVSDNGDRQVHAAIARHPLAKFRGDDDPIGMEVNQLSEVMGYGAFLPREVHQPYVAKHPIGSRRPRFADRKSPARGARGQSDPNFELPSVTHPRRPHP